MDFYYLNARLNQSLSLKQLNIPQNATLDCVLPNSRYLMIRLNNPESTPISRRKLPAIWVTSWRLRLWQLRTMSMSRGKNTNKLVTSRIECQLS